MSVGVANAGEAGRRLEAAAASDPRAGDVDAVLLDGLGTLLALQPPAPALVRRLRERHGAQLSEADAERAFGVEIAYYRAHHPEGRDPATLADLRRRCAEVLRAQLPLPVARAVSLDQLAAAMLEALRFVPYSDVRDALVGLRQAGRKLVVVSNWDVSLHTVLRNLHLDELLDGVVSSAEVGHPKPARAIFDAALRLAGSAPQRTVHVGDSIEHDVRGALAAGIHAVLLRRAGAGDEPIGVAGPVSPSGGRTDAVAPPGVPAISSLAQLLA